MIKGFGHILITLFLTASLSGCEPKRQHEVLTFFFTGVPPLDESGVAKNSREEQSPQVRQQAKRTLSNQILYSHPVWERGVCDPCHVNSDRFSTPGIQKKPQTVFRTTGIMPGELTLAKNKLCIQCHRDKTEQRAKTENLWLHNTTAKGDCLACHDPHQSKNTKILLKPPAKICFPCHEEGLFMATQAHQTEEECLFCHNPHMGLNKNLLKKEYQEQTISALQSPEIQN